MPHHPSVTAILKHFAYDHLPPRLRDVSRRFHDLAHDLADDEQMDVPELTVALRKLLESKDCAVRAALEGQES
ncbi:hypothetical protein [Streptomyces thermolilacinus]|uniref:hypothetical protein n=1 Tax=Streptomyces thermolilacinus TaxID=285540 RepID=UPI0033F7C795